MGAIGTSPTSASATSTTASIVAKSYAALFVIIAITISFA